jgi:hypothetical protein
MLYRKTIDKHKNWDKSAAACHEIRGKKLGNRLQE